jgi:hypothetical protein
MTVADDDAAVRALFGGVLDGEPLVAAQWCRPAGTTAKGHPGVLRALKRILGRGDGLRNMNLLAATATRLVLFAARSGFSGPRPASKIAEWPIPARLQSRKRTITTEVHRAQTAWIEKQTSAMHVLTLPNGIAVEAPKAPETTRLVAHVNGGDVLAAV